MENNTLFSNIDLKTKETLLMAYGARCFYWTINDFKSLYKYVRAIENNYSKGISIYSDIF